MCRYFQHCGASGNETGLVHLHRSLHTLGAVGLESGSRSHLPELYEGEEFGVPFHQNDAVFKHILCAHVWKNANFLLCVQISCMLGLFYLTSVAGLIATSAVLQQLSLSSYGQSELLPPADINLAHPQNGNLSPEASSAAQHLPCCIMKNKSLNCQTRSPGTARVQIPTWASSHTSYSCFWGSLLDSLGHVYRESNSNMEVRGAPTSKSCPDCLKSLPPRHCGLGNNSALSRGHGLPSTSRTGNRSEFWSTCISTCTHWSLQS